MKTMISVGSVALLLFLSILQGTRCLAHAKPSSPVGLTNLSDTVHSGSSWSIKDDGRVKIYVRSDTALRAQREISQTIAKVLAIWTAATPLEERKVRNKTSNLAIKIKEEKSGSVLRSIQVSVTFQIRPDKNQLPNG